jgi:hypothetical protein
LNCITNHCTQILLHELYIISSFGFKFLKISSEFFGISLTHFSRLDESLLKLHKLWRSLKVTLCYSFIDFGDRKRTEDEAEVAYLNKVDRNNTQ